MADGDLIDRKIGVEARYTLIDAAGATDNGVWVDTTHFKRGSIHIIPTTGTLQLRGSDEPTKPDVTAHGFQIASTTSEARVEVSTLPKWIKGYVSAHTTGPHNIYATLRR